jgi:aminoglycoside phosphotransferase family enzyme/predicted kinase
MLRPEFYPHNPRDVTIVQSHISYVLLAGDDVYKLKKPVRFSFLDFSTPALRRHFCHEEVRLNRRLAPDVYRGVVAICQRAGEYRLGCEEDPDAVEYAVHMQRLPHYRMLDQLLNRRLVTPEMIDAIAARLAEFHARADTGPEVSANGAPAAIWRVLEDNYNGVRPFRNVTIPADDDDAIQAFARGFLVRHDALLRRRQAGHRIRDCHGDLHSEHLCFAKDLVIFDCIEFNRQFRYCDVASEIAFLAMDLDYHQHPELAAHLISRYAAYADDPDLPGLVPFYQCYRAYVRGKVDSLTSAEDEVAAADREAARHGAFRHFALAYRYSWAYSPCLVAIAGLSGTGKSAIAAALHTRTGFAHINSDVVRKRLAGVPTAGHAAAAYEAGLYTPEHSARTYRATLADAGAQLAAGHGVIVDATFQRRADRDAARALAAAHRVPFLIVECRCAEGVVRRRLAQRTAQGESPSDADWSIYLEQRRRFERFTDDEQAGHLGLDTTAPPGHSTAAVEAALRMLKPPS